MSETQGIKHESLWLDQVPGPDFPTLEADLRVDVVIIGGGIAGLTAGHELKKAGLTVAILEQHRIAGGETGHTTAHLTQAFDSGLHKLTQAFGDEGARAIWEMGAIAIDHIEETSRNENIACHFSRVPGYYFPAAKSDIHEVEKEVEHAHRLGFAVDYVKDAPFPAVKHGAMRIANQAQFNPRLYLLPLAKLIQGDGCFVLEKAHVNAIHSGQPCMVEANGFTVTADHLIYATHQPIQSKLFVAKMAAYQTYVLGARVPSGTFEPALAWDTEDPYHYWRIEKGEGYDTVIIGGEDHRTGQEDDTELPYRELEAYVAEQLAGIDYTLTHRWSGQVLEPMDGAPFIGHVGGTKNEYVATAFSGNGMTMGTFSGLLLADMILGRENPLGRFVNPSRIKIAAGGVTFLQENLAFPTYLISDYLTPTVHEDLESLKPGEGKVLDFGGEKVAASRSADGTINAVSAVCTHMGCLVHWNNAETSWDCPCHGSRFMANGEVLSGPARVGLPPCQLKINQKETKSQS